MSKKIKLKIDPATAPEWFKDFRLFRPKSHHRKSACDDDFDNFNAKEDRLETFVQQLKDSVDFKRPLPFKRTAPTNGCCDVGEQSRKFCFLFRNLRRVRNNPSSSRRTKNDHERPKNVQNSLQSRSRETNISELYETNKKLCALKGVHQKLKSISNESSLKRKQESLISSSKVKNFKNSDQDSGVLSGGINFFSKTDEPQFISDRSSLNADQNYEFTVWHRVANQKEDDSSPQSQTEDPIESWNDTVTHWRDSSALVKNREKTSSESAFAKPSSNQKDIVSHGRDASSLGRNREKASLKSASANPSSSNSCDRSITCDDDRRKDILDSAPNRVGSDENEIDIDSDIEENVLFQCEFNVDSLMLQILDDIDSKWGRSAKKPVRKLNRLRIDDDHDDDETICVVDIL